MARVLEPNALSDLLNTSAHLLAPSQTLGVDVIDARTSLINILEGLLTELSSMRRQISAAVDQAMAAQDADSKMAEAVVTKLGGRVDTWQTRGRGRARITRLAPAAPPLQPVTSALGLPAIVVSSFDAVKQDGSLYWVDHADHFAVRLAGHLFHGNVGTVFVDDRAPEKIKDCHHTRCSKGSACDYYHDPMYYPGSTDRRNFVAPRGGESRQRARGRRFGSRDTLDIDIVSVTDDEISRQRDQCMHDILCALLLRAYRGVVTTAATQ